MNQKWHRKLKFHQSFRFHVFFCQIDCTIINDFPVYASTSVQHTCKTFCFSSCSCLRAISIQFEIWQPFQSVSLLMHSLLYIRKPNGLPFFILSFSLFLARGKLAKISNKKFFHPFILSSFFLRSFSILPIFFLYSP